MNIELKTKRQKSDAELAVTLCALVVVAGTATNATPFWPQHLGDAPPLGVVVLSLGLALAKLHYTLGWWRDLDEAAREAHKSAWWTGGNIGLVVAGAALAACVLGGFDPMPARFAGIPAAYATAGVLGVIAAQAVGYGVAWLAWWGARR